MAIWEFFVQDLEESPSYVGGDISAVWRVVPNDFSVAILSVRGWRICYTRGMEFKTVLVSAVVKSFLIEWCCFGE